MNGRSPGLGAHTHLLLWNGGGVIGDKEWKKKEIPTKRKKREVALYATTLSLFLEDRRQSLIFVHSMLLTTCLPLSN